MANEIVGEKRDGGARIRSSNGSAVLEETYIYIVRCDLKDESRINVLNTEGLPKVNITVLGPCVCKTKSAQRWPDKPNYWNVTCEFSSEVEEGQGGEETQDPTSDPVAWTPVYETNYERIQEYSIVDRDDDPIVNSNGRFFAGLNMTRSIPTWTFWQFELPSVTDDQILLRSETVNSNEFRGRPAKTLLLIVNKSIVGFYYGQRLRFTSYTLKYNRKNWRRKLADVDTGYIFSGAFKPHVVNGVPVLAMLDGNGGLVSDGDPPEILEFDEFEEIDFNDFLRV